MVTKNLFAILLFCCFTLSCTQRKGTDFKEKTTESTDTIGLDKQSEIKETVKKVWTIKDIILNKELKYDKHTLEDKYAYKDTTRHFQLNKIKEYLAYIESFQADPANYAVLQNHRNKNGEAALVKNFHRNAYTLISDSLGVERYQSVPLYRVGDRDAPILYGRDGSLVKLNSADTLEHVKVEGLSFDGIWEVPKRYVQTIGDTVTFHKAAFVDVTNQNILTVERLSEGNWVIRSMNPATSGQHKPPYAHETPVGMFVVQQKKSKMYYYADGTTNIAGYAPYASRFTNGAYIHGVPTNDPKGSIIETSWSLGTIPRSHMCVRNASSHAKFIYDWTRVFNALVIVID